MVEVLEHPCRRDHVEGRRGEGKVLAGADHAMGDHAIAGQSLVIGVDADDGGLRSAVEIIAMESVAPTAQIEDACSWRGGAADEGSVPADAIRP